MKYFGVIEDVEIDKLWYVKERARRGRKPDGIKLLAEKQTEP